LVSEGRAELIAGGGGVVEAFSHFDLPFKTMTGISKNLIFSRGRDAVGRATGKGNDARD
jgi:hypothetical protein